MEYYFGSQGGKIARQTTHDRMQRHGGSGAGALDLGELVGVALAHSLALVRIEFANGLSFFSRAPGENWRCHLEEDYGTSLDRKQQFLARD